jgi:hypothetical protein
LPSPLPGVDKFTAGPPGTAEAVLASDNDNPAAPSTGRVLLRRCCFCSEFNMIKSSHRGGRLFRDSLRLGAATPPDRSGFLIAHVPKEGSPHLPAEGASVTTDTQSNRKVISLIYDPEEETQEAFEARKAAVLGLAPDVRACVRG